jgi:hypothetical protein
VSAAGDEQGRTAIDRRGHGGHPSGMAWLLMGGVVAVIVLLAVLGMVNR